jgi:hypothetical protein
MVIILHITASILRYLLTERYFSGNDAQDRPCYRENYWAAALLYCPLMLPPNCVRSFARSNHLTSSFLASLSYYQNILKCRFMLVLHWY